jgi:outer membrane protein
LLFFLVTGAGAVTSAQTPAPPAQGGALADSEALTVEQAVQLALERNPQVLSARTRADVVNGQIKEVKSRAFPAIGLNVTGDRWWNHAFFDMSEFADFGFPTEFQDSLAPTGFNTLNFGVSLTQPLYTAGKVGTALKLAQIERDGVGVDVSRSEQDIKIQVVRAFYTLLLADRQLEIARETLQQKERHLEDARTRFQGGVATEVDVLRSQVSVANARPDLIRAENGIRYARSVLNTLLARPANAQTRAIGDLQFQKPVVPPLDDVVKAAFADRPELQRLRINEREAELQRKLANAESRLSLDLTSQYAFSARSPSNIVMPNSTNWSIGVRVNLPLFDGGRRAGLVEQAIANERIVKLGRTDAEDQVHLQAQTAVDELRRAELTVEAARASVTEAERVLKMMEENYKFGAATTLDVEDSQTALSLARVNLFQSLFDHTVARAQLRYVMGLDPLENNNAQQNP